MYFRESIYEWKQVLPYGFHPTPLLSVWQMVLVVKAYFLALVKQIITFEFCFTRTVCTH